MRVFLLLLVGIFFSCKNKEQNVTEDMLVTVDPHISFNDTIKLLSKRPELRLFNNELVENKTRTAYILQNSTYSIGSRQQTVSFNDYKCKSMYKSDTLEIWLNNNNGYFGNGVLIQLYNNKFRIKDIDPKTLRNEMKFVKSNPLKQKLILNKLNLKKNDSLYAMAL
ncbi:hypothetical protein [uncultured Chryseobacterium sp.]|uniref:hypothetical protein n=1 Tax=uncultured Chryseobacterium sp. TaxID=259322 RepID=UPI0025DD9AD9|nr:hypothetical protein [uncultured Chryseobacterium sp.]